MNSFLCIGILQFLQVVNAGLFTGSPSVVELPGQYPWEVNNEAAACPVLMNFYASWCPHCQMYAPTYAAFAKRVDDSSEVFAYMIAAVDCGEYPAFCSRADIEGYPTVKEFPSGQNLKDVNPISIENANSAEWMWENIVSENKKAFERLSSGQARSCAGLRLQLQHGEKQPGTVQRTWIPHPNHVWLDDQKRALHYSLTAEALRSGVLTRSRDLIPQLRAFVELNAKSFPDLEVRKGLASLLPLLDGFAVAEPKPDDSKTWKSSLAWLKPPLGDDGQKYFGCRGSEDHLRGYTCGLWQLFHALMVNSNNPTAAPHAGLSAIHGYMEKFFGCTECRDHFLSMAETMSWQSVATDDAAIVWLWKAHNVVNSRLKGADTEDPVRPKVQFPSPAVCEDCWQDGVLAELPVLGYLRRFYAAGAQWGGTEDKPRPGSAGASWIIWVFYVLAVLLLVALSYSFCSLGRRHCDAKLQEPLSSREMQENVEMQELE